MIDQQYIKELLFSGIWFKYMCYDHKEAVKELDNITNANDVIQYNSQNLFEFINSSAEIPDHIVWRTGKLREIYFKPNGEIKKMRIGNCWFKIFYIKDFGITVKPIIFKSDDIYDLINKGMAIENTI